MFEAADLVEPPSVLVGLMRFEIVPVFFYLDLIRLAYSLFTCLHQPECLLPICCTSSLNDVKLI